MMAIRPATLGIVAALSLASAPVLAEGEGAAPVERPAAEGTRSVRLNNSVQWSNKDLARIWDLEVEEIERYHELAVIERSFAAENISPIEVLGKHARTPSERRRYAEKAAAMQLDQQEKAMVWVIEVAKLLPPREQMRLESIDANPVLEEFLAESGNPRNAYAAPAAAGRDPMARGTGQGAHVRFFFSLDDCDERCVERWQRLRARQTLGAISTIDLIVLDENGTSPSAERIAEWGRAQEITPAEVTAGRVTINWQDDDWMALLGQNDVPVAIDSDGQVLR